MAAAQFLFEQVKRESEGDEEEEAKGKRRVRDDAPTTVCQGADGDQQRVVEPHRLLR